VAALMSAIVHDRYGTDPAQVLRLATVSRPTPTDDEGGTGRTVRALLSPFVSQKLGSFVASENAEDLKVLAGLIEAGQVTPFIDRTCSPAEVAPAITRLVEGAARGKTVVTL
jgi:hypothetical protein